MSNDWPDAHVATLVRGRREGLSASNISKALLAEHRKLYSRSAVCGKAHRLGLSLTVAELAEIRAISGQRVKIALAERAAEDPDFYRRRARKAWNTRMSNAKRKAEAAPQRPRPIPANPFTPLPDTAPIPFLDRRLCQCSWPVGGSGAELMVCAQPVAKKWCVSHDRIGFAK